MANQLTTIYIVRHGESEANVQESKRTIDMTSWDESGAPLTPKGRQQVAKLAMKLAHVKFDAIFTSNLLRARQTAEIIRSDKNIPIETVTTIYERTIGKEFWKLSRSERKKLENAVFSLEEEEKFIYKITPDSETAQEALDRFKKFLMNIIPLYKGKTILVVNHGGIMRFLLMRIGWATYNELPMGTIQNTGYFILETDGQNFKVKETSGVNKK
ncbi:MAG: histidine phosphatase family protein [Patescibacteria group bacterium]